MIYLTFLELYGNVMFYLVLFGIALNRSRRSRRTVRTSLNKSESDEQQKSGRHLIKW